MRLVFLLAVLLLLAPPLPAAPRYVIVLIGYVQDRTPRERELKERLKELLIEVKAPRGSQFSYHYDVAAERKYCQQKLGVEEKDLVLLGVARVSDAGLPVELVTRFPRADFNLEQAAQETVYQWRVKSGRYSSSVPSVCRLATSLPIKIAR